MSKPNDRQPQLPLTPAEIETALEHSGFPLEMRLHKVLADAGTDPSISTRFSIAPGDSAEVDLMARWNLGLDHGSGFARVTAMIEAKHFGKRVALVGFKGEQPDLANLRTMRARFSGLPSCHLLQDIDDQAMLGEVIAGPEPLASAFDAFGTAPVCPHWAHVRDKKSTEAKNESTVLARKDDDMRSSFLKLLRVTTWIERHVATFLRDHPGRPSTLLVEAFLPTVVVDTPQLYLYDPTTRVLETTQSLVIRESYEVGPGEVATRHMDVITEAEVPAWIERCRAAAEDLRRMCNGKLYALREAARGQAGDAWTEPGE